jgi:hypothetical protein
LAFRHLRALDFAGLPGSASNVRLYKYFPDVVAILSGWHERQIADHLEHLAEVRDRACLADLV